jgi:hypothetical protein
MTDTVELLPTYDAGLLSDFGGGNVYWWQNYIRAELGRAHDFYAAQFEATTVPKSVADGLAEAAARTAEVVEMAGASNLMNGVQLGQVSWLIKMNDALEQTRLALTEYRKATQ